MIYFKLWLFGYTLQFDISRGDGNDTPDEFVEGELRT